MRLIQIQVECYAGAKSLRTNRCLGDAVIRSGVRGSDEPASDTVEMVCRAVRLGEARALETMSAPPSSCGPRSGGSGG